MSYIPTICLDFDGVMNTYDGWKGVNELFQPREGLKAFLVKLQEKNYRVVIHSTRNPTKIISWLMKYDLGNLVQEVTDKKPSALVYLDDRALKFEGVFCDAVIAEIFTFKTHWEKKNA